MVLYKTSRDSLCSLSIIPFQPLRSLNFSICLLGCCYKRVFKKQDRPSQEKNILISLFIHAQKEEKAMACRNLQKMASIDAQLRLLAPGKVSEDDKLVEYDALLLDRFLDILQDLHGQHIKETVLAFC